MTWDDGGGFEAEGDALEFAADQLAAAADRGVRSFCATLHLTNFLGASAASAPHCVALRGDAPPTLSVAGGKNVELFRKDALAVTVSAMASACGGGRNGTDRAVGLSWALAGADGFLEVHSSSSDPRSFKLPAFSLDVGTYALTVTATDIFDVNASEVVALTVPRANVVAAIDGGAARSASAAEDLRVSASSSHDEDVVCPTVGEQVRSG